MVSNTLVTDGFRILTISIKELGEVTNNFPPELLLGVSCSLLPSKVWCIEVQETTPPRLLNLLEPEPCMNKKLVTWNISESSLCYNQINLVVQHNSEFLQDALITHSCTPYRVAGHSSKYDLHSDCINGQKMWMWNRLESNPWWPWPKLWLSAAFHVVNIINPLTFCSQNVLIVHTYGEMEICVHSDVLKTGVFWVF